MLERLGLDDFDVRSTFPFNDSLELYATSIQVESENDENLYASDPLYAIPSLSSASEESNGSDTPLSWSDGSDNIISNIMSRNITSLDEELIRSLPIHEQSQPLKKPDNSPAQVTLGG